MKTFEAYGVTWEVLDEHYKAKDGIGILCIAKEPVKEMAFSEDNDNNYETSDVRAYLSDLTEEKEEAGAEFLSVDLDLTADDGMKMKWKSKLYHFRDKLEVKGFFLLTDQMYRDYRFDKETGEKIISEKQTPWWTATAYSFSSGYSYGTRIVSTGGRLGNNDACNGYYGVVPACVFAKIPDEKESAIREIREELKVILKRLDELEESERE